MYKRKSKDARTELICRGMVKNPDTLLSVSQIASKPG